MAVKTYSKNTKISTHFDSIEIRCQHCGVMKIDTELITKIEHIFSKLNASKCIVSSGYRCVTYDKKIGGFAGRHSEGLAVDCVFYDKKGKIIPSKIVICVAYDLKELNGIAKINNNYVHLDNRKGSTYRGDETKGNSNYWTNPYTYFKVSASDVVKYTGATTTTNTTTNTVSYYKKCSVKYKSIVDALNSIGVNSSFSNRKTIAKKNGISIYLGTSGQNIKLLNLLKQGKLVK